MIRLTLSPILARKIDKLAAASQKSRAEAAADLIRGVITPARYSAPRAARLSAMRGDNTRREVSA